MKAVYLQAHGPIENLTYVTSAPMPEPKAGEVRVRVEAAAMNRLDLWVREGWKGLNLPMPHIPGADSAGVVDALGEGVTGWQVGERVAVNPGVVDCDGCEWCERGMENLCRGYHIMGETTTGVQSEYICVPARNLLTLPPHVDFATAAAAGLVYLTAWHSLIVRGNLRPGESVLIVGAGGGVNTASLQIAKLVGCEVYVVGSNAEKLAQAKALGADHLIDRSALPDGNWGKTLFQLTDKRGVDVVVDNVGAPTLMMSIRAARVGGRVITVGNTGGPVFEFDNRYLFFRSVSLIGSTMGTNADYKDVMKLVFAGKLRAVVGQTFPLSQIQAAHRALASGDVFGKVVLFPNE
jgi:NADPH:quinone reductase-like Zn-dependent oxidoreductase